MPSLLPGFEYDIFISYRQKDNKGDKWVSKFVDALKTELDATFKEDISIYFDENPHDRLQDTHNVNKSLEGKLKCLIFIPVLSQTYCDPNSYAWQYEFIAFNKLASEDQFGRDIKLRNGNYAGRILPVRIHDLEQDDIKLFEKETGRVLRAMDFVFKTSSGVNRPLKIIEDHPNDNLNKTFYGDQINKTANAIKEIVLGLSAAPAPKAAIITKMPDEDPEIQGPVTGKFHRRLIGQNFKQVRFIFLLFILCAAGAVIIYRIINYGKYPQKPSEPDKSIAVLPFANDSPDKDNEYFCNGMMEEILNQLQKIGDLKVKSRTSVEKYRNPDKDIKVIGDELGVSLIMEGSVRKVGDDLRITTQLIDTKTGDHLWSDTYDGKYTKAIFEFQSSVAKKVAASLNAVVTPQEGNRIDARPESDIAAYDLYLKGMEMCRKWNYSFDSLYLKLGLNLFNQALIIDPDNVNALGGKGYIYREEGKFDSAMIFCDKANKIDPINLPGAGGIGAIYMYADKFDSALKYIQIGIDHNPNLPWAYAPMGQLIIFSKNDITKGLPYYQKAYDLGGDEDGEINRHLAWIFSFIRDYSKALKYSVNASKIRSDCGLLVENGYYLIAQGNYPAALHFLDSISNVNPCLQKCDIMRFRIYTELKDFKTAQKFLNKALDSGYKPTPDDNICIAYMYKETGKIEEAFQILNNSVKRDETFLKNTMFMFHKLAVVRLAASYAILGKNKEAIALLSNSYKSGIWDIVFALDTFPGFDNLRNDPDFKAMVKRIEEEKAFFRAEVKEMEQKGVIDL